MIKLTIEDLQEIADFKVIEKPLIQKPLIAESDVVTIDNNLSTYVTGTQKRELTVNLGYLDRDGYEILRGFRDRQYENLKYPKASIIADIDIAPDGQIIESDITKSFNLTTNDNPLGVKSVELVKIGNNEDYIFEDNGRFYVHKATAKIASYNGETITTDYISTTGGLTTGATVYYVLATPVEYEITKDTLVELRYARTYVGQTNVWTEGNGYDLPVKLDYSYQKDGVYLPVQVIDSTYANLTDTLDAPLDITKLGGDTFQQTYSGKNLFDKNNANIANVWATTTGVAEGYLTRTLYIECKPNTTYTVSKENTGTNNRFMVFTTAQVPTPQLPILNYVGTPGAADNSAHYTITTPSTAQYLCVYFSKTDVTTPSVIDILATIQIEQGSQATSFEPYVGGVPAPNPDYPQEVEVVTGRQAISSCGKNLYKTPASTTNNGIKYTLNPDGTYNIHGTATAQANDITYMSTEGFTDGATYAFSATKTLKRGQRILLEAYNGSTWVRHAFHPTGQDYLDSGHQTIVGAINISGADRLRVVLRTDNGATIDIDNVGFQLEKANAVTSFEPYQGKEYEINLGKNLFDKSTVTNGYRLGSDGLPYADTPFSVSDYIPIQGNTTYTYSRKLTTGDQTVTAICYYDASKTFISRTMPMITNHTASGQVTSPANATYARIADRTEGLNAYQFEKGSTATSYAPYFTPIELCKIGTYQDYIYPSGGKWYLHKVVEKYKFTSSETGSYQSTYLRIALNFSHGQDSTAAVASQALCTHLKVGQTANANNTFGIGANVIYIRNESCTSLGEFNQWFGGNDVIVYYALATPTDTELTNEDLINQLEDLWSTYGFSEYTTIATSADNTGNAKPVLEATQGDITDKGTDYTLEGTKKMPMEYKVYGQAIQDGTPSTSTPIPIETVKGNNSITFTGPSGRKEYSIVGKMTLADQRIIDNCGTAEQVQVVFRESKQI